MAWTGGFRAVNGTRRDGVGLYRRGEVPAKRSRCGRGPTTEDNGKLGVKLGERGAKRALAGRVRATPQVAGDGKRDMRNEVSEAEVTHRDAVRPSPICPVPREFPSAALRTEGSRA